MFETTPERRSKQVYPIIDLESLLESKAQYFPSILQSSTRLTSIIGSRLPSEPFLPLPSQSQLIQQNQVALKTLSSSKHSRYESSPSNIHHTQHSNAPIKTNKSTDTSMILTAAHTLENKFIRSKIDVDLGSLRSFLDTVDVDSSGTWMNSHKKSKKYGNNNNIIFKIKDEIEGGVGGNQDGKGQDLEDDDKEPDFKKSKYASPLEALKYEDDEKRRAMAAKQVIRQLFRANFGEDADKFEENTTKILHHLKNQEDQTDIDQHMSRFIKKNSKKTFPEKLKILSDVLEASNNQQSSNQNTVNSNTQLTAQKGGSKSNKTTNGTDSNNNTIYSKDEKKRRNTNNIYANQADDTEDYNYYQESARKNNNNNGNNNINDGGQKGIMGNNSNIMNPNKVSGKFGRIESKSRLNKTNNQTIHLPQISRKKAQFSEQSAQIFGKDQEGTSQINTVSCFTMDEYIIQSRQNSLMELKSRDLEVHNLWNSYGQDNQPNKQQTEASILQTFESYSKLFSIYQKRISTFDHWKQRKASILFTDPDIDDFQKEYQEIPRDEVAIFQVDRIIAWNTRIEPSQSLFIAIHFVSFHALQRVEFVRTSLSEGGASVLLEMISKECRDLEILNLSYNKLGNRALMIVNKIISDTSLVSVSLRCVEMSTKQFCQVSLALAQKQTIVELDVAENLIDERAVDTIKAMIRYVKQLNKINLAKNHLPDSKIKEIKKLVNTSAKEKEVVLY